MEIIDGMTEDAAAADVAGGGDAAVGRDMARGGDMAGAAAAGADGSELAVLLQALGDPGLLAMGARYFEAQGWTFRAVQCVAELF